jgi:probable addiction module antidote protein
MALKTTKWNIVDYLDSEEAIAAYLEAAIEDGDPQLIIAALGDIGRAKGMGSLAQETGLSRESLYRSLSPEGNPAFSTIFRVIKALGLQLEVHPKRTNESEAISN